MALTGYFFLASYLLPSFFYYFFRDLPHDLTVGSEKLLKRDDLPFFAYFYDVSYFFVQVLRLFKM